MMEAILPYLISFLTLVGGWIGGRRVKRASEKKAEADASAAVLDNYEKLYKMLMECIVVPLKTEIDELRKETEGLRKDIRKLQRAIGKIGDCAYADHCPVRHELQNNEAGGNGKE